MRTVGRSSARLDGVCLCGGKDSAARQLPALCHHIQAQRQTKPEAPLDGIALLALAASGTGARRAVQWEMSWAGLVCVIGPKRLMDDSG